MVSLFDLDLCVVATFAAAFCVSLIQPSVMSDIATRRIAAVAETFTRDAVNMTSARHGFFARETVT